MANRDRDGVPAEAGARPPALVCRRLAEGGVALHAVGEPGVGNSRTYRPPVALEPPREVGVLPPERL